MTSIIQGIGTNDFNGKVTIGRKNIKEYRLWSAMLQRCYSPNFQIGRKHYSDCIVSENFKSYSYFYEWCQKQIGFDQDDYHLDKDIMIKGNKLYSEDTCCFVPRDINVLFTNRKALRGKYLIGASLQKRTGRFQASCKDGTGKLKYLGIFPTQEQAFEAYKAFKESIVKRLANEYKGLIDDRVYHALMNHTVEITD